MKKLSSFMLSLLILTSCGSLTRGIAPELEVIKTKNGVHVGGTVVYNPYGIHQLVSLRKSKAYSRMRKACLPNPYRIEREETVAPEKRNIKYNGNMKALMGKKIRFIDFICSRP